MTRSELEQIAINIKADKKPYQLTKREFVNALGCEKRTSGNVYHINNFLENNEIETYPSYIDGWIDEKIRLVYKPRNIPSEKFKLYSLTIDKYKNLKDVTIDFEYTDNYCAFIGLNGSGKSNVLEAISAIFQSLYQKATIQTNPQKYNCKFSYTICYAVQGKYYQITDGKLFGNEKITTSILPKNIIASYSGEDTRLWKNQYKPIYEKYCSESVARQGFEPPFLFYINRYQWEIAMLVLLYSEDIDVKQFIRDLAGDKQCTITFEFVHKNSSKWTGTMTEAFVDELKQKTAYTIDEFRDCINNINFIDQSSTLFYCLYKSSTGDNQLISKININFNDGSSLDGLSEGEKRMILINTIIHILATENSLCLFDEPDSHIHISKKAELINLIDNDNRYCILTTHSPIFLDKLNKENIRIIDKGKLCATDIIKNISEISGGEINYIEGAFILTSRYTIIVEGTYDIKYIKKAIEIYSSRDDKYKKLKKIAFLPMGSAGNAQSFFDDLVINLLPIAEKVLFVFDYDKAVIEGWSKIEKLKPMYSKLEYIFYQQNYTSDNDNVDKNPSLPFFVEDLFCQDCYSDIVSELHSRTKYNEFKTIQGKTTEKIKTKIEKCHSSFDESKYTAFQPLLDKLLNVFFSTIP